MRSNAACVRPRPRRVLAEAAEMHTVALCGETREEGEGEGSKATAVRERQRDVAQTHTQHDIGQQDPFDYTPP